MSSDTSATEDSEKKEETPTNTNVVLVVDNKQFVVDKQLLISKCDYFRAMFSGSYKESSEKEIVVQVITSTAFEYVLDYFNTNTMGTIDLNTTTDILHATNYLHLSCLRRLIVDRLLSLITFESCFHILHIAKECGLADVETKVKSFALYSFHDMLDFIIHIKDLTTLYYYLSHENLNVKSEYDVFATGLKWLKENNTEKDILVILSCVLFKNLDAYAINNMMNDCKSINDDRVGEILNGIYQLYNAHTLTASIAKNTIDKTLNKYNSEIREIIFKLISTDKQRTPAVKPYIVKNTKGKQEIVTFNVATEQIETFMAVPEPRWWGHNLVPWRGFNVLLMCGKLKDENAWNQEIQMYNCFTCKWSTLPTFTLTPRRHATAIVNNDDIYLIGGFSVFRVVLASVQKFNVRTNTWTDLPHFPEHCSGVAAAFHHGKLYVSCEKLYVLNGNHWQILLSLPSRHSSIISYENVLYFSEKWRNKLWYWETGDEESDHMKEFTGTHYNVISGCRIGNTAYFFSTGEVFEYSSSVETCCLDIKTAPSKTNLVWIHEDSDWQFDVVTSSFTLSILDAKDNSAINSCGETWLKDGHDL